MADVDAGLAGARVLVTGGCGLVGTTFAGAWGWGFLNRSIAPGFAFCIASIASVT